MRGFCKFKKFVAGRVIILAFVKKSQKVKSVPLTGFPRHRMTQEKSIDDEFPGLFLKSHQGLSRAFTSFLEYRAGRKPGRIRPSPL
jgi:hypothetical protein